MVLTRAAERTAQAKENIKEDHAETDEFMSLEPDANVQNIGLINAIDDKIDLQWQAYIPGRTVSTRWGHAPMQVNDGVGRCSKDIHLMTDNSPVVTVTSRRST